MAPWPSSTGFPPTLTLPRACVCEAGTMGRFDPGLILHAVEKHASSRKLSRSLLFGKVEPSHERNQESSRETSLQMQICVHPARFGEGPPVLGKAAGEDQGRLMGKADPPTSSLSIHLSCLLCPSINSPSTLPTASGLSVCLSAHLTVCFPSGCLPCLPPGPQFCTQVPASPVDRRAGPRGAQPGWTPECEQGPGGG